MTKKKKQADEVEYDKLCGSFREVLKTPQGKEVLWHILGLCNLYGVSTDKDYALVLEGQRQVGIDILQVLESVSKDAYPRLLLHFQI